MILFELISEHARPVAALVPGNVTGRQLKSIYELLPPGACLQTELQQRWQIANVLATPEWSSAQLHRKPMLKPRGKRLAFLGDDDTDRAIVRAAILSGHITPEAEAAHAREHIIWNRARRAAQTSTPQLTHCRD